MASRQLPPLLQTLIPAAQTPIRPPIALPFLQRLQQPLFPSIRIPIPFASILSIPSLLGDIWESVLRAVPKKKTSHRKKRQRFMAGKGLKDVNNLVKCPACGRVKLAHVLCPYCVTAIRSMNAIKNLWRRYRSKEVAPLKQKRYSPNGGPIEEKSAKKS